MKLLVSGMLNRSVILTKILCPLIILSFNVSSIFASEYPRQKSFFVMDGSCCGGAVEGKTCHDVMNEPNPDFTKTIAIINGGIECGISKTAGLPLTEFLRRNRAFKRICGLLGIPVQDVPPCGTTCNSWAKGQVCYSLPSAVRAGSGLDYRLESDESPSVSGTGLCYQYKGYY